MKISWFEIVLIFAFRTSRQGSSPLRSIISVIDHPEGGYSTVVLHKNYVLGVLWSLNSIQTQYKRFWSILVDTDITFSHQNPDFGSRIRKLFSWPSLTQFRTHSDEYLGRSENFCVMMVIFGGSKNMMVALNFSDRPGYSSECVRNCVKA